MHHHHPTAAAAQTTQQSQTAKLQNWKNTLAFVEYPLPNTCVMRECYAAFPSGIIINGRSSIAAPVQAAGLFCGVYTEALSDRMFDVCLVGEDDTTAEILRRHAYAAF